MTPEEYQKATLMRDYQDVFKGSQKGLRVLFDLINKCSVFTVNTKNPHDSAVLEGKRHIGVYLMTMVQFAPQYGGDMKPKHLSEMTSALEDAQKYHDVIDHESQSFKEDESK